MIPVITGIVFIGCLLSTHAVYEHSQNVQAVHQTILTQQMHIEELKARLSQKPQPTHTLDGVVVANLGENT